MGESTTPRCSVARRCLLINESRKRLEAMTEKEESPMGIPRTDDGEKDDVQDIFGTAIGFLAFFIWGLFPLYFALLRDTPPLITLAFRAIFTTVLLVPVALWFKRGGAIIKALCNPRYAAGLFITMATTAVSWGLFIWLVAINRSTYASLGNYMCPLVTVVFAAVFFRERLRSGQIVAISIAVVAVVVFACGVGRLPWESVVVAFVFAIYSAVRKAMDVDSTTALSVETIFAAPIAVGYVCYVLCTEPIRPQWSTDPTTIALLVGGGAMTAVPILLFGVAARRCSLTTLGILNYLTPTGQFLCGTCALHEATTFYQLLSFALIWLALTFFTIDLFRNKSKARNLNDEKKPNAIGKTTSGNSSFKD